MPHLKDIANQGKLQTFPSATFEIEGEVPESQCSESRVEGDDGYSGFNPPNRLVDPDNFIGWNLTGKVLHITENDKGGEGDYDILSNTNSTLILLQRPPDDSHSVYYISNGGSLILTRDITSFAKFIDAAGYAYTIKGRKLYTNIPSPQLQPACSILFDPLT